MKNLKLRGHKLGWKLLIMATVALVFSAMFVLYQLNFTQAVAQDESAEVDDLASNGEINIDREQIGNEPFRVKVHLFNDKEFSYKDSMYAPPVDETDTVLEAEFPTSTQVIWQFRNVNPSIFILYGRTQTAYADHNYTLTMPEGYGIAQFATAQIDERTAELSIVTGIMYDVTLHTDKGIFPTTGTDECAISVVEGGQFPFQSIIYKYDNLLGYTYEGNDGPYIHRNTIVPSKGTWSNDLNALWESAPEKTDVTFEVEDSEFVYNYVKSLGTTEIENKSDTSSKIDVMDFVDDGEKITGLSITYSLCQFTINMTTLLDNVTYRIQINFSINGKDNKIISNVLCNGVDIGNQYAFSTSTGIGKTMQKFVVNVKDSHEFTINVSSPNRVIFNCQDYYSVSSETEERDYYKLSNLDINVPEGYYPFYQFGPVTWYEENMFNMLNLNNNANLEYSGMILAFGFAKYEFDESTQTMKVYRHDYMFNGIYSDDLSYGIKKDKEIKNVYYGEEQLKPFIVSTPLEDNGKSFTIDILDNTPVVYDAHFDANGGQFSDANGSSDVVDVSQQVTTTYNLPQVPIRDGYTFDGWFSSAEGGEQYTSDTYVWDPEDESEDNTDTFYAHWTQNEQPPVVDPTIIESKTAMSAQTGDASLATVISVVIIAMFSTAVALRFRKN